ncbi:MAG: hypothetical protein ACLRMZ_12990 [Blautia marasmi]
MNKSLLDMLKSIGKWPKKPVISLWAQGEDHLRLSVGRGTGQGREKVLVTTTTHMEHPAFWEEMGS